jgi:hypothetical protein
VELPFLWDQAMYDRCEGRNMIFRLIRIDNEQFFPYPPEEDKRSDRICVELDGGKITKPILW